MKWEAVSMEAVWRQLHPHQPATAMSRLLVNCMLSAGDCRGRDVEVTEACLRECMYLTFRPPSSPLQDAFLLTLTQSSRSDKKILGCIFFSFIVEMWRAKPTRPAAHTPTRPHSKDASQPTLLYFSSIFTLHFCLIRLLQRKFPVSHC